MAHLLPNVKQKFFDSNGVALAGGKLYSYEAGTTTPLATYTDQGAGTPNANPTILDANGEASIWIGSAAYKFVLKDSDDNTLWTVDNVSHISTGALSQAMLADGILTADSAGRLKMADGYVNTDKLADNALAATSTGRGKMQDGFFTADSTGRAKFADSFINAAKIEADAVTTDKILNGNVTFAKLGTDFIASATSATPVFADSILICDASDSNLTKRSTLTQVRTLLGVGTKRTMQYLKNAGAATITNVGFASAPTTSGTLTSQDSSLGPWLRHTTAASAGSAGGFVSSSYGIVRPYWQPEMFARVQMGDGFLLGDGSIFVGFMSASVDASIGSRDQEGNTAPAIAMAGFYYGTSVSPSFYRGQWVPYTSNGAAGVGNSTRTGDLRNSNENLRIVMSDTEVQFYIDEVLVATHTTTLPASNQALGFGIRITAEDNAAVYLEWSRVEIRHV